MLLPGALYLEPSVTLGVTDAGMSQYREYGPTSFNLDVHRSHSVAASVSPMVELGAMRSIDDTHAVRVFADLGAAAYSNNDWKGEANLELAPPGTGSFIVDSKLPSVVGRAKAGVDMYAGSGVSVKVSYSADAAPGFISQEVLAKITYAF
jgi:hypothetical protein